MSFIEEIGISRGVISTSLPTRKGPLLCTHTPANSGMIAACILHMLLFGLIVEKEGSTPLPTAVHERHQTLAFANMLRCRFNF